VAPPVFLLGSFLDAFLPGVNEKFIVALDVTALAIFVGGGLREKGALFSSVRPPPPHVPLEVLLESELGKALIPPVL